MERMSTLLSSALGQGQASSAAAAQRAAASSQAKSQMVSTIVTKVIKKCLPKGTFIDIEGGKTKVEDVKTGDIILGYYGTPVKVMQKHEYIEDPSSTRFFEVKFKDGDNIRIVNCCDMHKISNVRVIDIKENDIVSKRSYNGVETSYDLLTEDIGYRIDGIPVNSMIPELKEDSDAAYKNIQKLKIN